MFKKMKTSDFVKSVLCIIIFLFFAAILAHCLNIAVSNMRTVMQEDKGYSQIQPLSYPNDTDENPRLPE